MEKKCSSKEHQEIDAILYCKICNIYMCNKCENFHQKLFDNHSPFNLKENYNDYSQGNAKKKIISMTWIIIVNLIMYYVALLVLVK